jgi:hypothetical protein
LGLSFGVICGVAILLSTIAQLFYFSANGFCSGCRPLFRAPEEVRRRLALLDKINVSIAAFFSVGGTIVGAAGLSTPWLIVGASMGYPMLVCSCIAMCVSNSCAQAEAMQHQQNPSPAAVPNAAVMGAGGIPAVPETSMMMVGGQLFVRSGPSAFILASAANAGGAMGMPPAAMMPYAQHQHQNQMPPQPSPAYTGGAPVAVGMPVVQTVHVPLPVASAPNVGAPV